LTTHADEWAQLLEVCSNRNGTSPTTTPRTAGGLLGYEDILAAFALVQAVDPSQPYYATGKNWFMTILNWTEWGPGYWSWPDYGPRGNLETGEILRALAIWYDLQYHTLSEAEQIDASFRLADYADRYRNSYSRFWTTDHGELTGNHCWNAFSSLAAVRYASDHISPTRMADWSNLLDGHYNTISNLMSTVMSDGVTGEGMTYWTYGIEKVLLWFEMRRAAGNPAFEGIDWFANTGTYGIFGITPGGTDNFGGLSRYDDTNPDFWGNPYNELSILAAAVGDPVAQWMSNELDHGGSNKKNAYRYIFYDPTVLAADPDTDLNNWHFFDDYGLFFWRSSWADSAQHFTIRSGQHSHGHSKCDDGQFMLSRAGIPYIANLGYAVPRYTQDANVLLVNGTGQYSEGDDWGTVFSSWPANSNTWGKTLHVLACETYYQKGDFFNVLIDPTQMYTNPVLSSWQREVVGLGGDLYLLRDTMAAASSADFDLLLHAQVTVPSGDTYDQDTYAAVNPWSSTGAGTWEVDARPGSPKMLVQDISAEAWSPAVEESRYYDKYDSTPPTRRGSILRRSLSGTDGTSLMSFGFEDLISDWTQSAWTNAQAEGIHVTDAGAAVIDILWPLSGVSVDGSDGWSMTGKMAGRRYGDSFFGRDLTFMQYTGLDLLQATAPVSFHAKTEHLPGGTVPNRIYISSEALSTVTLYAPFEPASVQLDGSDIPFTWADSQLTFTLPATPGAVVDLVDAAYLEWRDGRFSPAEIETGLSALSEDPDGDGCTNWKEFVSDTDPRSGTSHWDLYENNGIFSFGTSTARHYTVEVRTNLVEGAWSTLSQDLPGNGSDMTINDTNGWHGAFYRVRVSRS
jgi:hypothetical protein